MPCAVPYDGRRGRGDVRRAARRAARSTRGAALRCSPPSSTAWPSWTTQRGWVQQFHLGALRNNNTPPARRSWGRTWAATPSATSSRRGPLARFLDGLDREEPLAKTILYNLNPRDNELFATMVGNFNDGTVPGKMQYGAAWWFLDQKDGHRGPAPRALEPGPALALRGHDHGLAQLPVLLAPRLLPADPLQPAGRRTCARAWCRTTATCWAGSSRPSASSTRGTTSGSPWGRWAAGWSRPGRAQRLPLQSL